MGKQLSKMNKTELINLAISYGVIDKAENMAKENNRKDGPINADLLAVLEPFKSKINMTATEPIAKPAKIVEIVVPGSIADAEDVKNAKPLDGYELHQAKVDDLFRSIPVIVIDNDSSQDVANDTTNRGEQFSWGNPSIGIQRESVFKHGQVQYLYNGTIKHISKITMREKSDKKGQADIVRARFVITEVPEQGFSQDQLDSIRAKQVIQG